MDRGGWKEVYFENIGFCPEEGQRALEAQATSPSKAIGIELLKKHYRAPEKINLNNP